MEKTYAQLMHRARLDPKADAVSAAIDRLRRHSCYTDDSHSAICSRCENNDENRFKVTDIDIATGSVTEVKCSRCKETSYPCRSRCYCDKKSAANGLECSYKEIMRSTPVRQRSWSMRTCMCSILEATAIALVVSDSTCPCANSEPHQLRVIGADRLGFITSVQCRNCRRELAFSPLEESYIVQMLYRAQQREQHPNVFMHFNLYYQQALNRHLGELCNLLRRHSFYDSSICPEYNNNDQESCRVVHISRETGEVKVVEFVTPDYNQSLQITCRSDCYYDNNPSSPSKYEKTYKAEVRRQLEAAAAEAQHEEQANEVRSGKAVLSCTVLAAAAAIMRRHSIDNKLCPNCKNDNYEFLHVVETDKQGFIKHVMCSRCGQSLSTACRHSRFYYEEIDESVALKRGDHVCWHRNLAYWHHAIVTGTNERTVTVAEYVPHGCSLTFEESIKSRQDMSLSCGSGTLYLITHEDCYTDDYTAIRAEKSIGEKEYNLLNRNCEHISHWCKTGLSNSDQVTSCFSSVGKTLLAFGLRILNMLLLVVFQAIHEEREDNQKDRKTFERFERILVGVYMSIVFLLFLIWSLYTECKKLKPASVNKCCCSRHPGIACRLSIRIITREIFAAAGPFLVIWFEDSIGSQLDTLKRQVIRSFIIFAVYVGSYLLGAVAGTLLEYISRYRTSCGNSCTHADHSNDDVEAMGPTQEDPEIGQGRRIIMESTSYDDTSTLTSNLLC